MVSTKNNANSDHIVEEQTTMIHVLQAQMEELWQKEILDQLCHEEDRRRKKEDRRRQAEEVSLLREQNNKLLQQLEGPEQKELSRTSLPPHSHQSRAVPPTPQTHQTPQTLQTHQTHQSSKNDVLNDEEDHKGHPFTDKIIVAPLPDKWKGLTIKLDDGSTDPNKHLNIFKTQMTLYTTDKAVWCKVFPTSLQEGLLGWFTELPSNFVTNFKVLTTKFTTQYATSWLHHTSSMSLLNVKQEKWESLITFMDRFNKVCMGIKNLNPKIAMHHLVSAIRPRRFTESLIKRPT